MRYSVAVASRCVSAVGMTLVLAGCGLRDDVQVDSVEASSTPTEFAVAAPAASTDPQWRVPDPGPLTDELLTADVLVVGNDAVPEDLRSRISAVRGVRFVTPLSLASVGVADRSITIAAADAASYRRFTPAPTAEVDDVWRAMAAGDVIISHQIGQDLHQDLGGTLDLRDSYDELPLRVGAYATTVPQVDAVVNERRGEQLGMKGENALLVSLDHTRLAGITQAIRDVVGNLAEVQPLSQATSAEGTRQAAYLTGGAVARAVGSFAYRYFADGTVEPDPRWVAANIRTETVPILGRVTCHRVMLTQLRAALSEIVQRDLANTIDVGDYGGCYVPRFIGRDPRQGLSLHTWGIAIDLNVAGNQRGSAGEIDRRVVAIMKKWGFAWGGDWQWTDPMHFELAALVHQ